MPRKITKTTERQPAATLRDALQSLDDFGRALMIAKPEFPDLASLDHLDSIREAAEQDGLDLTRPGWWRYDLHLFKPDKATRAALAVAGQPFPATPCWEAQLLDLGDPGTPSWARVGHVDPVYALGLVKAARKLVQTTAGWNESGRLLRFVLYVNKRAVTWNGQPVVVDLQAHRSRRTTATIVRRHGLRGLWAHQQLRKLSPACQAAYRVGGIEALRQLINAVLGK